MPLVGESRDGLSAEAGVCEAKRNQPASAPGTHTSTTHGVATGLYWNLTAKRDDDCGAGGGRESGESSEKITASPVNVLPALRA